MEKDGRRLKFSEAADGGSCGEVADSSEADDGLCEEIGGL